MSSMMIISLGVVAASAFWGLHKGFLKTVLSMVALLATILIVIWVTPKVEDFLRESTTVQSYVTEKVVTALTERQQIESEDSIDELSIPAIWKNVLKKHNNEETYHLLGVSALHEYVGVYLGELVIQVMAFLISMVVVSIGIHLLFLAVDLLSHFPVIHGVNKMAGFGLGFVRGILLLWIFAMILTIFSQYSWSQTLLSEIQESSLLTILYDHNLFVRILSMITVKLT